MRSPLWRISIIVLALLAGALQLSPAYAQDTETEEGAGQDDEGEGQESVGGEGATDEEGTEGQGEPEAESGADEGQTEDAAQTGPPWTYQMARISLALLVLMALGIGWWYYRFVVSRQRGAA